jgi:hypothetical protein
VAVFPVPATWAAVRAAPGLTGRLSAPTGGTGVSNNRRAVLRVVISGLPGLAFIYGIEHLIGIAID